MIELFSNRQNVGVLKAFKVQMDAMHTDDEFDNGRNSLIRLVVGAMANRPEEWDRMCQVNAGWIGDQFISRLKDKEPLNKERLDDICSYCFRFLFELYLSTKNDLAIEFEQAGDL